MATLKIQKTDFGFGVKSTVYQEGRAVKGLVSVDNMDASQVLLFMNNPAKTIKKDWYKDLVKAMTKRIEKSSAATKKIVDRLHKEQKVIDDKAVADQKKIDDDAAKLKEKEKEKLKNVASNTNT